MPVELPALPYLSGIQTVEDGKVGFNGPLNTFVEPKSSNYYMEAWFGEQTLTGRINTIAIVTVPARRVFSSGCAGAGCARCTCC